METKKKLLQEELSVMEAVDNLSSMAELDQQVAARVAEIEREGKINWLDHRQADQNRQVAKESFRVIHNYLRHIYEKEKGVIKDTATQRSIQSIMVLAGEAAHKLDKYSSLFQGINVKGSVTQTSEYLELQKFYLTKIHKKMQQGLETEDLWQEEWGKGEEGALDVERRGLKDLETVRRDKEYELFYILKEDGKPFFNRNLIRHIRLVGDFDEVISDPSGEDPFLKIKLIEDREANIRAKEILQAASHYVDKFYKDVFRLKDMEFIALINQMLMALMLASNPRNLLSNTIGKSCHVYFRDFDLFLRKAVRHPEYLKLVAQSPDSLDNVAHSILNILHIMSFYRLTSIGHRAEEVEFIRHIIEKGLSGPPVTETSPLSFWSALVEWDEGIRNFLKHYPNGPLLKTLDVFREEEEREGFDPLLHENLQTQMYNFTFGDRHITALRLPCPTRQLIINKAEVVEEFGCFLRALKNNMQGQKHLIIDIQDRTSWQEYARCLAIEEFQKRAEFVSNLVVVTLPKSTDFYLQTETYHDIDEAVLFIDQLKEQVASAEECGFYFPAQVKRDELNVFADQASQIIHEVFFGSQEKLSRNSRIDFVEIFYLFLTLKIIEIVEPDSISFTCKDSIDTGAAMAATFFSFLRVMNDPSAWTEQEKNFLIWMLYSGSLLARERSIDLQRFNRLVSSISTMHAEMETNEKKVVDKCGRLFSLPFFSQVKIQESI